MLCLLCSGKRFDAFDACCGLIARCSLIGLGEQLSDREVIASELFSRLWIYPVPVISSGVPAGEQQAPAQAST